MMNRKQLIAGMLVVAMVLSTTVAVGAFAGVQASESNDIGPPVEAMAGGFAQMGSEQHVMELLAETKVANEHACLHGEYGDRIPLNAGGSVETAPTVNETHEIWEITYTQDAGYVVFDTSNYPYSDKFVFYTANGTVQPLEGTVVKRGDVPECDSLDGYVIIKPEDGRIALKLNADSDEPTPEPPGQSANVTLDVRFGDDRRATIGASESVTAELVVSEVPDGLSGYDVTVRLTNPSVANIADVQFSEALRPTEIRDAGPDAVRLRAADIGKNIEPGAENVTLATVTLEGTAASDVSRTNVTVEVNRMDDDTGSPITPTVLGGRLIVSTVPPIVNGQSPTDPDGDGLYEDTDGDGRLTFNDVVVLFQHLSDPAVQNNAELYDFNGNGRLGFDDVVELFEEIGTSSAPQTAMGHASAGERIVVGA